MTADLYELIEMRDVLLAAEVSKKAELGWFDTEFTMYGCAYMQSGERFYRLSADAEKIYDFIEKGEINKITPTNLLSITERFPVPLGMKEAVALDVKRYLAIKLQELYSCDFFEYLDALKKRVAQDSGYIFLKRMQQELEGCFNNERLTHYEEMVEYFYCYNKLYEEHYYDFQKWLAEERQNIEKVPMSKEQYEKTFYGIAYIIDDSVHYLTNARKETIYKKRNALMFKGIFVSPIFSKTYYYNVSTKLPCVKAQFEADLKSYFTFDFVSALKEEITQNKLITKSEFQNQIQFAFSNYGISAKETVIQYGYRWGILYQ